MNRHALALGLLLLGGCTSVTLTAFRSQVSLAPQVLDVGDILLGAEITGEIRLDVDAGSVKVIDVNVLGVLGDGFSYDGPEPFTIEAADEVVVEITFRPTAVGPASAVVQFSLDADGGTPSIEVRGRAVQPLLVVTPSVVDFGAVAVGEAVDDTIQLENVGTTALAVTGAIARDPTVTVDATFPFTIESGATADVDVVYTPTTVTALATGMTFDLGTLRTPELVLLRGNDCVNGLPEAYDLDADGVSSCARDCDDDDATRYPGATEVPDDADNDCDGVVDEGTARFDDDQDGYCEDETGCVGTAQPGDCNDANAKIHPGAVEIDFDELDNDCDGTVDKGAVDLDGDGYGPGAGDCDDNDASRHPGAVEVVNGTDDDCNSKVDDGTAVTDDDNDGYCESASFCFGGALPGDCADANPDRHPDADELPNFVDDDCDGRVDEGTVNGDDDGDGFTETGGDCDDGDPDVNPARGNCP